MLKRKIYLKLLMSLLLTALAVPQGKAETITICGDGTQTTSNYTPIYGSQWGTTGAGNQFIFPASELTNLPSGAIIKKIKFFSSSYVNSSLGNSTVEVRLGNTSATKITSLDMMNSNRADMTLFYTGNLPTGSAGVELASTEEDNFVYDGGNLIVDIIVTSGVGRGSSQAWTVKSGFESNVAVETTGNGSTFYNENVLAKMEITYEQGTLEAYAAKVSPATTEENPLAFGKLSVGDSKTLNVTLKNAGTNPFTPSVTINGTSFSTTYSSAELASSATVTIPVTFNPATAGSYTGTMTINCGDAGTFTVYLSGNAVQEITAADGTGTDSHLPVYGNYFEADQINQMIYPATMLNGLNGKSIKSMTFYPQNGIRFYKTSSTNGTITFSLANLAENTSGYDATPVRQTGYTEVATITMPESAQTDLSEWTIVFDTPFEYNGGDLLIDVETDHGQYGNTNFYGENQETYQSYYSYKPSYSTTYSQTRSLFLPKVSFSYSDSETPAQPYAVTVNPENGYDFGNVLVDNTKVWTLTVTNNGTNLVTPTLTGLVAPFTTNYTATALAAGESATIEITFTPTEKTNYSSPLTLSFPEANGAIANYTYNLTGIGVDESYDPTAEKEVVKLITVDKRSIYVPDFVDSNPEHSQTPQQLNCYDMRFRMAQLDDPTKQIKAGDLHPGNNLYEFYAIDDFGTEFRFATINLFAEGQPSSNPSVSAMDAPIKVTPSVEYYTEEGMPVHQTFSHNTTLNYTEKTYTNVNDTVDLYGVIDYVNDTWSANTATNSHPDHYKFQIRGVGQFGDLVTSLTSEYVESHMTGYGNSLVLPEGWERGSWVGPNNEIDNVHSYYYYDLYIKRSFFEDRGITGPVTVVVNTTLSGSGFNADNYKAMSVNGVEQIIAKEAFKDYSWTVPLGNDLPENTVVEQVPMGVVIRLVSTGADFNRTTGIYIYGGGTGVSNIDTVGIYKSSMNVKAYTQKQVDEDTDRNLVAMKNGDTETNAADVNVLAYADPAVTGYTLYENSSASTSGMTQVATATHNANGSYSVNSVSQYTATYDYERDESLGNIDGRWLPMYPADASKYFLPVTTANGVGDDGVVRSEGNTYGSAMQQVEENGSVTFSSSKCYKGYTWTKDNVKYALYSPEVNLTSTLPTGYELYNYRLWIDYEDDAPAWDFESIDGKINLTDKMDRPLYDGTETHIGGEGHEGQKDDWAFVAPDDLEEVKLVARFYYKKSTASHAPGLKARPTDSDRLYYVVENQVKIPTENIVTGIDNVLNKTVANVKYYNLMGVESATPFQGVNIVVTTYDDGTRSSRKVIK